MGNSGRQHGVRRPRAVVGPFVAALTAAGLLVGVGGVALHESDQAITKEALAQVESNRDAAIRAVERQASDLSRTITAFAHEPDLIAGLTHPSAETRSEAGREMQLLAGSKGAPAVMLADLSGRAVVIYPPQPALLGKDFSGRDWFKGAQRTGRAYVSSAYTSLAPGAPMVVGLSTPVVDAGKRVGYLTVIGQLDQVRAVAEGARHDNGVVITVTDQLGQRLTLALPVDEKGHPLTESVERGTMAALTGTSVQIVGKQDLAAAGPVPGVGWTVTASLPRSDALATAAAFRRSLGLSIGLSLILLLGAAGFAMRSAVRRAMEHDEVEIERARLTTLFAESPIGIVECNRETEILTANRTFAAMLGYAPEELIGTYARDLVFDGSVQQLEDDIVDVNSGALDGFARERTYLAKDGSQVPVHISAIVMREGDGAVRRVVSFIIDLRQQKRIEDALRASEDRLKELALHDDLTGLPNRRLLLDRCTAAFAAARRGGVGATTVAALFIDLDGFKPVNDLQGHEAGDELLVDIAKDLLEVVRPTDTVARVGGDEFVILVGTFDGVAHLHEIAERVTRAIRREVTDGETVLYVTASVGVATIDLALEPAARPDQLLGRADIAMYRAKELGRDRHDVYAPQVPVPRPVIY